MKSTAVLATLLALSILVAGCAGQQKKQDLPQEDQSMAPARVVDPAAWAKGDVFRVWPYRNGELMAWLGAKDGLQQGDILILSRDGSQINTVEVLRANEETCLGRVYDQSDPALLAQVGDIVIKGPQPAAQ